MLPLQVLGQGAVAHVGLEPLAPWGEFHAHVSPLHSEITSPCVWDLTRPCLCPFQLSSMWLFRYFFSCGITALLVFRSFSERITLCVVVALACPREDVNSGPSHCTAFENIMINCTEVPNLVAASAVTTLCHHHLSPHRRFLTHIFK